MKNEKSYTEVLKTSKRGGDWNSQKAIFDKIFKSILKEDKKLKTFLDMTCGIGAIFKKLVVDHKFKKWIGLEINESCITEWGKIKDDYGEEVDITTEKMDCFDYKSRNVIQVAYLSFNTFSLHEKHKEVWHKIGKFLKRNDVKNFVFADTASMWFKIRGNGKPYDVEDWDEYVEKVEDTIAEKTNHEYDLVLAERFSSKKCAIFHFKKA